MPSPQRRNKKKGCLALGYRSDHFRIAGQVWHLIFSMALFSLGSQIGEVHSVTCQVLSSRPQVPEHTLNSRCVLLVKQMAVAIVVAMLFVVINPLYNFLGEYALWIVITVGELHSQHAVTATCMHVPQWEHSRSPVGIPGVKLPNLVS